MSGKAVTPGEALHSVTKSMTQAELVRFKKELERTWLAYLKVVVERAAREQEVKK